MAENHAQAADRFTANEERTTWHDSALWHVRTKRDDAAASVPDWEELRQAASEIKEHTLAHLDDYLKQFENCALSNGIHVHWAKHAAEHNTIVAGILESHNASRVVKSKSMLTEECGLNDYLETQGVEIIDTDLGERIIQLKDEDPSHIVMPAIHVRKEEIGRLFHEKMGTAEGESRPEVLTAAARSDLRQRFIQADAAITGVNFAVAESGGIVVCTNEGNADLGIHLAPVHIASMGIEKIIPRARDLAVFLRLLARSATGQPVTVYTSHVQRPRSDSEIHVILVDNGRSEHLGRPHFRSGLKCIRCGACMNTCPVYRRSGGHSYRATLPGPIGAVINPGFNPAKYSDLPFASTLCGSCSDVCPVKIDIHEQLYRWRQVLKEDSSGAAAVAQVMQRPRLFRMIGRVGRMLGSLLPGPARKWRKRRMLPPTPPKSLDDMLKERSGRKR